MAYLKPFPTTKEEIKRAKISDGQSVDVTVPASTTLAAYEWTEIDGFFGVTLEPAKTAAGETKLIALQIEQAEYETSQITTSATFNKGDKLYFSKSTKKFTATDTDRLVGVVTQAKDANNVIHFILGPQA